MVTGDVGSSRRQVLTELQVPLEQQPALLHLLRVQVEQLLWREGGQGARAEHPLQLVVQTAELAVPHHAVQLSIGVDCITLLAEEKMLTCHPH